MNPNNYASLAASNRLVEAGIVLETDCIWVKWYSDNYPQGEWRLMYKALIQVEEFTEQYPAACFTEVWMELPQGFEYEGEIAYLCTSKSRKMDDTSFAFYGLSDEKAVCGSTMHSINPTDALIDLLIHIKGIDAHK